MRGTKHANDATAKRLGRQLRQLLEDPDACLCLLYTSPSPRDRG